MSPSNTNTTSRRGAIALRLGGQAVRRAPVQTEYDPPTEEEARAALKVLELTRHGLILLLRDALRMPDKDFRTLVDGSGLEDDVSRSWEANGVAHEFLFARIAQVKGA
jgi:hypothetical protein